MFVKRGSSRQVLFLTMISVMIFLIASAVSAETGFECATQTESSCSAINDIYVEGYGAVELCDTCYKCGNHFDGVCPEDYSDGRNETNDLKTTVKMRVPRTVNEGDEYTVAFASGNLACASIGGTCSIVKKYQGGMPLEQSCLLDVSSPGPSTNATYEAHCINVPRKPGCEYCPDVDCTTTLAGKAYDVTTNDLLEEVTITASWATMPPAADYSNVSNVNGNYMIYNAVRGVMTISCAHDLYTTQTQYIMLQRGKNIYDCQMNNLPCNPGCFTQVSPDADMICQASCHLKEGCFMTPAAQSQCNGQLNGSQIPQSTEQITLANGCLYTNTTVLNCCTGTLSYNLMQISCGEEPPVVDLNIISGGLFSADVDNILTRNYRKEFNGLPVTLKIIVYKK